MSETASRVSVSRDILRAELAEMELRLRVWIGSELDSKASAADFGHLQGVVAGKVTWAEGLMPMRDRLIEEHIELLKWRLDADRGQFTDAQIMTMDSRAQDALKEAQDSGWTARQHLFAWAGVIALVLTVVTNFARLWLGL